MKNFLIITFSALLTLCTTNSQVIEENSNKQAHELYNYHFLKQKNNNTTALVLLGAGVAVTIGTYISYSNSSDQGLFGNIPSQSQIVFFGIGGASAIASILSLFLLVKTKERHSCI